MRESTTKRDHAKKKKRQINSSVTSLVKTSISRKKSLFFRKNCDREFFVICVIGCKCVNVDFREKEIQKKRSLLRLDQKFISRKKININYYYDKARWSSLLTKISLNLFSH